MPESAGYDGQVFASLQHQSCERVAKIVEPLAGESQPRKVLLEVAGHVDAMERLPVLRGEDEPADWHNRLT